MRQFDVLRIGGALYLIVQADHLLSFDTCVLLPLEPDDGLPVPQRLVVEVDIEGKRQRILAHSPLTVDARRIRHLEAVDRLDTDTAQRVMDGLNTILWGL